MANYTKLILAVNFKACAQEFLNILCPILNFLSHFSEARNMIDSSCWIGFFWYCKPISRYCCHYVEFGMFFLVSFQSKSHFIMFIIQESLSCLSKWRPFFTWLMFGHFSVASQLCFAQCLKLLSSLCCHGGDHQAKWHCYREGPRRFHEAPHFLQKVDSAEQAESYLCEYPGWFLFDFTKVTYTCQWHIYVLFVLTKVTCHWLAFLL